MGIQPPSLGGNAGMAMPSAPLAFSGSEEQGVPTKASVFPLLASVLILLASIGIQVFQYQLANNLWYYVGYVLTPLLVTMGLAWDTLAQRRGRKSPWFEAKPIYSKLLRLVVAAGFVVAVFHIVAIGIIIGEQVVQAGVN